MFLKLKRSLGMSLLLVTLLSSAPDRAPGVRVEEDEVRAEGDWLQSLGLKGNPVLEHPFDLPLSRRSFIVPTGWYKLRPKEVPPVLLRKDLPILREVMARAYSGWETAEMRGWNWNRWFEEWDAELAAMGPGKAPAAKLFEPFAKLQLFQADNHTGPMVGRSWGSGSRSMLLASKPSGSCSEMSFGDTKSLLIDRNDPGQQPKQVLAPDLKARRWYLSYPAYRGNATKVLCGGVWVGLTSTWQPSKGQRERAIAGLAKGDSGIPSYRPLAEGLGYLRLPTFTKENGEILQRVMESPPKDRLLVVDLRGNQGGDIPGWAMSKLLGEEVSGEPKFRYRLGISCLYAPLRWGYAQVSAAKLRPPLSEGLREDLQRELDRVLSGNEAGCPLAFEDSKPTWRYADHSVPKRARFLVLVDDLCGSDCEYASFLFASQPGVVIAGVSTYGVGQYMQPGYTVLPHSRVPVRIALGSSDLYGDARSFDGYGLHVDVLLDSEESHSEAGILALARKLEKKGPWSASGK